MTYRDFNKKQVSKERWEGGIDTYIRQEEEERFILSFLHVRLISFPGESFFRLFPSLDRCLSHTPPPTANPTPSTPPPPPPDIYDTHSPPKLPNMDDNDEEQVDAV